MAANVQILSQLFPITFGQEQIGPLSIPIATPVVSSNGIVVASPQVNYSIGIPGVATIFLLIPSSSNAGGTITIQNNAGGGTGGLLVSATLPLLYPLSAGASAIYLTNGIGGAYTATAVFL